MKGEKIADIQCPKCGHKIEIVDTESTQELKERIAKETGVDIEDVAILEE